MRICYFIIIFSGFIFSSAFAQGHSHKKVLLLMGSRFEITVISEDEQLAQAGIEAAISEISRIEQLISSWDAHSETSLINRNAGIQPVKVTEELFNLIQRSVKVSRLTQGAFDITVPVMFDLWKFDGTMEVLPGEQDIMERLKKVGYEKIELNRAALTVYLKEENMRIGFGAIGKGYAANKAKKIMQDMGIENGLVNAGGDLISWGYQQDGQEWQIGIADPGNKAQTIGWLKMSNMAVVTSGDYEKFTIIEGKKYSHIMNPQTGYPAAGLKSVTVVCPDAELADALATAVFVMGEEQGISLINQMKGVECLVVNEQDELITSKHLMLNYYKTPHARSAGSISAE